MYPLGATASVQQARPRSWGRRLCPLRAAPRVFPSGCPSKVKGRCAVPDLFAGPKAVPTRCDHPAPTPRHPTPGQSGFHRRDHVNTLPRLHTPPRASPPSCALPGRAIHAARDGPLHAPTGPGSASPGLRRLGEALALAGQPAQSSGGRPAPGSKAHG